MKSPRFLFLVLGMLLISSCSAPKNLFVLMPDVDGTVGTISVKNNAGEQFVKSAGTAVKVKDAHTTPGLPKPIAEKDIQKIFQSAMSVTPDPPARFILQFNFDTTMLAETSLAKLSQITATVKERQPCDVRIVGHTDTAGPAQKNWELGLQRAKTVKQILIDQGIDVDQIQAVSHGEKDLLILTPDNVQEPKNRRVEVLVR